MSRYPIQRFKQTVTVANGGTTANGAVATVNGILRGIVIVAPNMTSSTYTVKILDDDGNVIFSKASLNKSATSVIMVDASTIPLAIPLSNSGTAVINILAASTEGAARDLPVTLLIER